jgi:hypothetical protein
VNPAQERLAAQLCEARLLGGAEARSTLLALLRPSVRYMALNRDVATAEHVAEELLSGANGELARRLEWSPPQSVGTVVRLTGSVRPGAHDRGLVLTVHFDGDGVVLLQEQRMPAQAVARRPLSLPQGLKDRIDSALAERHPMLVAHVGPQGQPVISFRGSVQAFSDDQLALWIRAADGGFIRAIRSNPRISLMYRDEQAKATYQFQGRARVCDRAADRQHIFDHSPPAERAHDFAMLGAAVLVDLDRVEGYAGLGPQGQIDPVLLVRETVQCNDHMEQK